MREIARGGLGMARGTDSGGVIASAHLDFSEGDEPRGVPGELRAGRAGVGVLHAPSRVHLGGRCGTLGRTRARRPWSRGREVEPPSRRARGDARRSTNAPKVARAGMTPVSTGSDPLPSPRRAGRRTCFETLAAKNFHMSTGVTRKKKALCDIFQRPEIKLAAMRDVRRPTHRNHTVVVANRARDERRWSRSRLPRPRSPYPRLTTARTARPEPPGAPSPPSPAPRSPPRSVSTPDTPPRSPPARRPSLAGDGHGALTRAIVDCDLRRRLPPFLPHRAHHAEQPLRRRHARVREHSPARPRRLESTPGGVFPRQETLRHGRVRHHGDAGVAARVDDARVRLRRAVREGILNLIGREGNAAIRELLRRGAHALGVEVGDADGVAETAFAAQAEPLEERFVEGSAKNPNAGQCCMYSAVFSSPSRSSEALRALGTSSAVKRRGSGANFVAMRGATRSVSPRTSLGQSREGVARTGQSRTPRRCRRSPRRRGGGRGRRRGSCPSGISSPSPSSRSGRPTPTRPRRRRRRTGPTCRG